MANNIQILDRARAASHKPRGYAVLTSIHDRSEPPLDPRPGWVDVLRLRFHDASPETGGLEHFTPAQAAQVVEFAQRYLTAADYFIVHCHHGRSRSTAIALALATGFKVSCTGLDGSALTVDSCKGYNQHVFKLMMDALVKRPEGHA